MQLLSASETLAEARAARAAGDLDACIRMAALANDKAREAGESDTCFLALCAPGKLYATRGENAEARGWYRHALDAALEFGLTKRLPECYHDLYVVSREDGDTNQSRRYFATSAELYLDTNNRHPRIAALYADAAEGAFMLRPSLETAADALLHWRSFSAVLSSPEDRFLGGCSTMAAAAWIGLHGRYMDGVTLMEQAYPLLPDLLGASQALLHAAGGALRIRDYPRAVSLASEALRVADERGESVVSDRAGEALNAALAERTVRA